MVRSAVDQLCAPWFSQLLRFAVTGGSGLLANLAVLALLVESIGIPEVYASILSTGIVLSGTFVLTDRWVFSHASVTRSENGTAKRATQYYLVMGLGKAVNYGIYLFFLWIDVWYLLAWVLGSVIVFVGSFSVNRELWVR